MDLWKELSGGEMRGEALCTDLGELASSGEREGLVSEYLSTEWSDGQE